MMDSRRCPHHDEIEVAGPGTLVEAGSDIQNEKMMNSK